MQQFHKTVERVVFMFLVFFLVDCGASFLIHHGSKL